MARQHQPQSRPRTQGQIYVTETVMKPIDQAEYSLTAKRRANHIYAPYTLLLSGVNRAAVFDIQSSVIAWSFHLLL